MTVTASRRLGDAARHRRRPAAGLVPGRLAVRLRIVLPRLPTAPWRVGPDFLVLGAQRAGTTSLFDALGRHPQVVAPPLKELHHFDHDRPWPTLAYRAWFPRRAALAAAGTPGRPAVTGEATPAYLFHPAAPARVAATLPAVRAVVLLREPVARAWSHFRMLERAGANEGRRFREAVEHGTARLHRHRRARDHWVAPYGRFAIFERGLYADQLRRWQAVLPPDRLLVLRAEDWFGAPAETFARVCHHLGIEAVEPTAVWRNRGDGAAMPEADRRWLAERYAGPNDDLVDLTGIGWDAT